MPKVSTVKRVRSNGGFQVVNTKENISFALLCETTLLVPQCLRDSEG